MIHPPNLRSIFGRSLAFAAVAVAFIALRIVERGESFQPHTLLLLAMVAGGALPAGAMIFTAADLFATRWPPLLRGALAAPLLAIGFAGGTALIFALIRPVAEADLDMDDHHWLDAIGILRDAVGLFVTTGGRYWLPWPTPAIGLAGGLLAAVPSRAGREAPSASETSLAAAR